MISVETIEKMAQKLSQVVPGGALTDDLKQNFQAILQASLAKLNLVTREEFDRQSQMLAKVRERLQHLEQRVSELEQPSR